MAIASINPATGETFKCFTAHSEREIEAALERAQEGFQKHRRSSFAERATKMRRAAEVLETEREGFARIITTEMGKLLRDAVSEIEKCARGCHFYGEHAEEFLRDEIVASDARGSSVRYEPLGVILA